MAIVGKPKHVVVP